MIGDGDDAVSLSSARSNRGPIRALPYACVWIAAGKELQFSGYRDVLPSEPKPEWTHDFPLTSRFLPDLTEPSGRRARRIAVPHVTDTPEYALRDQA